MNQDDIKPCRSCGEPMFQPNERACGVCTACVAKSYVKSTVIPTPGYRVTAT